MSNSFRPLGSTGLMCHVMGFGSYRINEGNPVHERALRTYLDRGGNLIDTSANYGDGLSELLIGRVLQDYKRDEVIVVTKGGYIQGQNMELAREREFPDTVRYANDLWHNIHPDFLETQIDRSLKRLATDYVDVYLIHNPEYYINYTAHQSPITDEVLDEFYRRIWKAFEFLESCVASGRIHAYGISSNNFALHGQDRARTSVERCLAIARELSSDHRFRVVEMPMNLYEAGGCVFPTNDGMTALEFCREHELGVLLNRPINAFYDNQLVRLADFVKPGYAPPGPERIDEVLRPLGDSEEVFRKQFENVLFGRDHEGLVEYLRTIALDLPSRDYWDPVMERYIIPPVTKWLRETDARFRGHPGWAPWKKSFIAGVNAAVEGIERYLQSAAQPQSDRARALLYDAGYPHSNEPLSRIALSLLLQLDGVSSVLNGMRSPAYVEDSMGAPGLPDVEALQIIHKFQTLVYP